MQAKHHISSVDAQPSLSNGLIVFVTGQLLVMFWLSPMHLFMHLCRSEQMVVCSMLS